MKFAHIADTHIRNLKYHFEYKEVFKQLYHSLKEEKVDYIVHCGDIAHTKTQISPEFVDLCRDFFENLASIAPTYIILGNHDGNLRNESRQDALSPIVRALSNPQLILLKGAGEVHLDDQFCLNVLSVFDEDNWVDPSDDSKVNIALYHGAIDKSKTDSNWTLGGDHSIEIFDKFDFAFLGDIHKTQKLDTEGRIWYAGSTVQQNFGESLDKGYLLWDIESKDEFTNKLITFKNPKPFVTIPLTKAGNLPRKKPPPGARLRIVSEENVTLDKVRKAVDIAKYRYDPESVTYLNRAAGKQIVVDCPTGVKKIDLRALSTQEDLIRQYLDEYEVSEDVMKKVFDLNKKYNTIVEDQEDIFRNVQWSLSSLEWDYLFNYGDSNSIDFSKLEGIVGIFGKNYSGKSSIVDSLLYTMYNSTSKSIRKNLNIINQNQDSCTGRAIMKIDGENFVVERTSEKYTKRLHGVSTTEAKTDLEFYKMDEMGNQTVLNGTSRQDTDKNIRKYFGSLEDFLLTSMASQLDSLSFVNEGSTKRKEILAKFLDLEVFDKKFKLAKEDSALTKASLRKLEGIDFPEKILSLKRQIARSELGIETNRASCLSKKEDIKNLEKTALEIKESISSIPNEIIDPVITAQKIEQKKESILRATQARKDSQVNLENSEEKFVKVVDFLSKFDNASYEEKKGLIDENRESLRVLNRTIESLDRDLQVATSKRSLLSEVPCGSTYPSCKFIKDAHSASEIIQIMEPKKQKLNENKVALLSELEELDPDTVESRLGNYFQLVEKKNELASIIAQSKLDLEKSDSLLFREQVELESLEEKSQEYHENRDAIENLKDLLSDKRMAEERIVNLRQSLEICENNIMNLHKRHGALEQELKQVLEMSDEYETLKSEFAAYHLLMTCYHPNGVAYDIIKDRLPAINQEIAKILTNIVDFEIFIKNDDKKLDVFIKHPEHGPRPLEMGSGAEKTIASMAIRLAFLTVSSLPKSDLFILDEPGTALDEENMEGFVRILDMVKGYFKTVILISHLDSLKDCVDMQINIEKRSGYAHVSL